MRFVAEVKSTMRNEEKQLRLDLGQVLRYANLLDPNRGVVPVLVAERQSSDRTWEEALHAFGSDSGVARSNERASPRKVMNG